MDEFESFIADSADEVRMYPSDRIWRNIDKELHGEKQWPALTFGAVLTTALMLATLIFLHPDKDLFEVDLAAKVSTPAKSTVSKQVIPHSDFVRSNEKLLQPIAAVKQNVEEEGSVGRDQQDHYYTGIELQLPGSSHNLDGSLAQLSYLSIGNSANLDQEDETSYSLNTQVVIASDQKVTPEALPPTVEQFLNQEAHATQPVEMNAVDERAMDGKATAAINNNQAVETLKQVKPQRWGIQYYGTPSISYRILSEEKYYDKNLFPGGQIPATYYNDVRRVVNQNSGFGAEVGTAITYAATDGLILKAGLQFNLRQYNINAYKAGLTQASAIRLQQGGSFDTLMAASNVINYMSDNPTQIQNQHIQLSIPVGFELAMAQFGKSTFFLSATLQPTYNINSQAWLITSDYQRYVQQQSLVRNFTLNTGLEAFFRFKTKGNLSWQIGPQIRYQLSSTFAPKYPVKENLIDYGFKIGLSKTLH